MSEKPIITIAIQCHNFQHRLCWMLSSLVQQTQPGLVAVDIAHVRGNGNPTTEKVLALFSETLAIRSSAWDDFSKFQLRGLVRNRQIMECSTEWLMFGDSDMVYHPDYFNRLITELGHSHREARYMISSGRTSNPSGLTNFMVTDLADRYPITIAESFRRSDALVKRPMRNVGAGFCQLINMRHCPHGGYYVKPEENRDWRWSRGSNPKSDMQFRRRIGRDGGARQKLPHWFSENAIHLNHDRDPEAGKHLETQR